MILEGTTSSGAVVPVQVTGDGKVVAEGLQGPQGPEGPEGPEGPPGPAGGYWERTGTAVSPTNAGDNIVTTGRIGAGTSTPSHVLQVEGNTSAALVHVSQTDANASRLMIAPLNGANGTLINADWATGNGYLAFGAAGEKMRINNSGVLTIGSSTATPAVSLDPGSTGSPLVRDSSGRLLVGTTSNSAACIAAFQGHSSNSAQQAIVFLQRGSTTLGIGDGIGELKFSDSAEEQGALIKAVCDGTWTSGSSHPGCLVFSTTPSGSASPVERLRIDSQGDVIFQGAPIIKSPDGKHWAIEVDNTGNLSAIEVL